MYHDYAHRYKVIIETNFFAPMEGKSSSDGENARGKNAAAMYQKSGDGEEAMAGLIGADAVAQIYAGIKDKFENPRSRESKKASAPKMKRELILYGDPERTPDLTPKDYGGGLNLSLDAPGFKPQKKDGSVNFRVPAPPGIRADVFSCIFEVIYDEESEEALVGAVYYKYRPRQINISTLFLNILK